MDPKFEAVSKTTVPLILERKLRGEKVTCLTAYDTRRRGWWTRQGST